MRKTKTVQKMRCNTRGATLAELMVTLLLLAMFMSCLVAVLRPMLNSYAQAKAFSDLSIISDTLFGQIAGELTLATEVTSEQEDTNRVAFLRYGGEEVEYRAEKLPGSELTVLMRNGQPVFSAPYYNQNAVRIRFEQSDALFHITIELEGKAQLIRNYTVKVLALAA